MNTDSVFRLNLACGNDYREGWVNIDDCSMYPDCKVDENTDIRTLERNADSAHVIALSHFAMYLRPEELAPLLKRWHGWLKECGTFELECIDVKKVAKIVASSQPQSVIDAWGLTNLFGTAITGPHRWGWTAKALLPLLYQAGFSEVKVSKGKKNPNRDFLIVATK